MNIRTYFRELTKVALAPPAPSRPVPINAVPPAGPRVPTNGLGTVAKPQAVPALPPAPVPPPPASGVFPRSAAPVGAVQSPVTPATGRAAALAGAARANARGPKKLQFWQGKIAEADPGHGKPGHNHAESVKKLRAVVALRHPHLLAATVKKAAFKPTPAHFKAIGLNESDSKDMSKNWGRLGLSEGDRESFHKVWRERGMMKASSVGDVLRSVGSNLVKHEDAHEIAGLATLALPSVDNIQARLRGGNEENDKHILPEYAHDAMEVGGLGYLAAPMIAKKGLGRAATQAIEAAH